MPELLPPPETIGNMIDHSLTILEVEIPEYVASKEPLVLRRIAAEGVIRRLREVEWSERT